MHFPPEQCGFRKQFGSHTLILRMQIMQQYCQKNNLNLHLASLDIQEAFERAWRPGILYRLQEAGISGKLWRIIKDQLHQTYAKVKANYGYTKTFRVQVGVVQGSVLSALHNLYHPTNEGSRTNIPYHTRHSDKYTDVRRRWYKHLFNKRTA